MSARVSVVIPSWNTSDLLHACLVSLEASEGVALEVIVVDNASADGSADMVAEKHPDVVLVRNDRNEGFARGCNQGMEIAGGTHVLLLNADTEVAPGAIAGMVAFLESNGDYGAVAPRLVHPDGRTQKTVMRFPKLRSTLFFSTPLERWLPNSAELRRYFMRDWDQESERDIDQPPAACLLLTGPALEKVGHFDEDLWLFFNDVDLSLRLAAAGLKTRYLADLQVVHHVGASTRQFGSFIPEWHRNRLTFYRKHFGLLATVWVKACAALSLADFVVSQLGRRLSGKPAEPVGPMLRAFGGLLLR